MRINTNLTAINTLARYERNNNKIADSVAKLSSGYAINGAKDNAAGLAISEKMRAQIRGLEQASANSQDAISLIQTAEGALASSSDILQRLRELAVQSANDANGDSLDRVSIQDEFTQLQADLEEVATTTVFNKKNLLDGSLSTVKRSVTNAQLANNSLSVSIGNAAAGAYNFNVKVKQESAAIAGKKPTDQQATFGNVAANYFSVNATAGALNGLASGAAVSCAQGANASASALLNGNYSMTTAMNADGSMTVTASGDNDQSFTALVSSSQLAALETGSSGATYGLKLTFSAAADDAFSLSFGVKVFSNTENGRSALRAAIEDTTVSVVGGVTAQDAKYGVYASVTGAEDMKLRVGATSVSFTNGVTVSFNKLSAADLDTKNAGGTMTGLTAASVSYGTGGQIDLSYSNFKLTDDASVSASAIDITRVGATNTLKATIGSKEYTWDSTSALSSLGFDATAQNGDEHTVTAQFTASDGSGFSLDITTSVNTASSPGAAYSASVTDLVSNASGAVTASGHNYSKVFGDGVSGALTENCSSQFLVEEAANAGLTFQIGANSGDELTINIDRFDNQCLGLSSTRVNSQASAIEAIDACDKAISLISSQRAYLGAIQNRLNYKLSNLHTSSEKLTSAESTIRDVDMAKEMTKFTSSNILGQAATAMLAQANSLPQNVLSLIG
jgi:flagellin